MVNHLGTLAHVRWDASLFYQHFQVCIQPAQPKQTIPTLFVFNIVRLQRRNLQWDPLQICPESVHRESNSNTLIFEIFDMLRRSHDQMQASILCIDGLYIDSLYLILLLPRPNATTSTSSMTEYVP